MEMKQVGRTGITLPQRVANRKTSRPGRFGIDGKFFTRAGVRFRVRGVTYGPFAPDANGDQFPAPLQVTADFEHMRAAGINAVRTYHAPPDWFLDLADEWQMAVLLDVPWPKHLCFLDSCQAQQGARAAVERAAKRGRRHPCLLGYSIGNEVPPNVARWHGVGRVERFIAQLRDICKQADPEGLVTYANYPPTEYLDLPFLDFATFNVYLHDRETFRHYLFRLQNLVGDRPLLLGELGMDTFRHGEQAQADFLAGHFEETVLMGLAGAFVFSWTDEWFTGGCPIENWAFGITCADRSPKPAYHALREIWEPAPAELLCQVSDTGAALPRVSVVVCTYNGGRTLDHCIHSLLALDYPDYEVIVVDDGSTDDTPAILDRFRRCREPSHSECAAARRGLQFPELRVIRQTNQGLSVARNIGLQAATGSIVAYTDDDCYADPDWLTHLVYQLQRSGADAVGGPNLSPEDGRLAACVAAAPGQPTHVLTSDQVAEHIPGCNMAFCRQALVAINGFDPIYRKAGDDVDVCWRLQSAGKWITFAPGAFVWHHRRQNPRAYLRQQAGYGEAEALLQFKHPDRFTERGHGKWRGVLYGDSLKGLRLAEPVIYHGTFAVGLFQCLYRQPPAHWAMLPATLEWHLGLAILAGAALFWPPGLVGVAVLWGLSVLVAALQAAQARLAPEHRGVRSRCLIALLCYLQPLVRSWHRYRTRISSYRAAVVGPPEAEAGTERLPLTGRLAVAYWSEEWRERTELLDSAVAYFNASRWGKVVDSGWQGWDLRVFCHPWSMVEVCTAQEDHGGGRRLIRVRYRLRLSGYTRGLAGMAVFSGAASSLLGSWFLAIEAALLASFCLAAWWCGTRRTARVVGVFDMIARGLNLIRCEPAPDRRAAPAPRPAETPAGPTAGSAERNGHVPPNGVGAIECEQSRM
jgi:GT2 family glycosyltransferase